MGASDACVAASAAALLLAAAALASSFSRQQCLYFRPEPQWQGSLRPGRVLGGVIQEVYRIRLAEIVRRSVARAGIRLDAETFKRARHRRPSDVLVQLEEHEAYKSTHRPASEAFGGRDARKSVRLDM